MAASSGCKISSLKVARRRVSPVAVSSPSSVRRKKDTAGNCALLRGELVDKYSLRRLGNGAAHAARGGVAAQGQDTTPAPLPGFQQGMRKQRQRPGLMTHIVEEQIRQPRLQLPAAAAGWLFDGAAQLVSDSWRRYTPAGMARASRRRTYRRSGHRNRRAG